MSTPSSFEQSLNDYRERLSNVKAEEVANIAKRIAESDKPLEELKQVIGEVTTPLALDFLKEGIMHRMGVSSAQIVSKKGKLDFKQALEKEFDQRMGQLKDKAKGVLEDAQQKIRDGLSSAKESIKSQASDALSNAKAAVSDAQKTASDAIAEGKQKAVQAVSDAQEQVSSTVESARDAAADARTSARNAAKATEEDPAAAAEEGNVDVDGIQSLSDVRAANSALQKRYNNLNEDAQQRVRQKFEDDEQVSGPGEGSGEGGIRTLDDYQINIGTQQDLIAAEEQAGNFKGAARASDIPEGAGGAGGEPAGAGTLGIDTGGDVSGLGASRAPLTEEQARAFTQPQGAVQQRIAQEEAQQVQLSGGQQLPTAGQGAPKPSADTTVKPTPTEETSFGPEGAKPVTKIAEEPPKPPGGAAAGAEETGEAVTAGAEGAGAGIEGVEAGLLASGPETGGLGALAAGLVGIGATIAGIFTHHKEAPAPPTPQIAQSLQSVGIR